MIFSAEKLLDKEAIYDEKIYFNHIPINRGYGMHETYFEAPRGGDYRFSFSANSNDDSSYSYFGSWHNIIEVYFNDNKYLSFIDKSNELANNIHYTWMMKLTHLDKIYIKIPHDSWYFKSDFYRRIVWHGQLIENIFK